MHDRMKPAEPVSGERRWDAPVFVWAVWLAMSLALFWLLVTCRTKYPNQDEWALIPFVTGVQPLSLEGLWAQHNEHHMPLVKLVLGAVVRLSRCDFRAAAALNALLMSGLTAGLIIAARRLRGRTDFADAFLPLVLLHWGHYELYFTSLSLNLILSAGLSLALLLLALGGRLTRGRFAMVAACLVAIPFCGASGLPSVVAFAGWLAVVAVGQWRGGARKQSVGTLALGAAAAVWVAVYFIDFRRQVWMPPCPGRRAWLNTALECLSSSCLPWVPEAWPASAAILPALLILVAGVLVVTFLLRPAERLRVSGVALFLAANVGLIGMIALSRSGFGTGAGAASRYGVTAAPLLLAAFLTLCRYGPPPVRRLVQTALLSLACAVLVPHDVAGWNAARGMRDGAFRCFDRDVRSGTHVDALAEHYSCFIMDDPRHLAVCLRGLRQARVPGYRDLRDGSPSLTELPLPSAPSGVHEMTGDGSYLRALGCDPYMVYVLAQPRFVEAIRVRYRISDHPTPEAQAQVCWRRGPDEVYSGEDRLRYCRWPADGEWRTRTVWIHDTVHELRIDPAARPCGVEIEELTLLLPQSEGVVAVLEAN